MGNSVIYHWLSSGISTIITLILLVLAIIYGVFCAENYLGVILFLICIWGFIYFIAYPIFENRLASKYEYTFENYIYRIRKDTLVSGKERYYPIVSIAKYGIDQYIQKVTLDNKTYWELTNFSSEKEMKKFRHASNIQVFYDTKDEAKNAIESFKKYEKERIELNEKTIKQITEEKNRNKVANSEFLD